MQYVDTVEFSKLSGKSDRYIRKLCSEGKLPCIQEQVDGGLKLKYLIDIDDSRSKKHFRQEYGPEQSNSLLGSEPDYIPEQNSNPDKLLEALLDAQQRNEEYAKEVGKVELLTDNIRIKEQDSKYWQDKYFEKENEIRDLIKLNMQLENANKSLLMRIEDLKVENEQLKEQLNKKPSFLGMFRK